MNFLDHYTVESVITNPSLAPIILLPSLPPPETTHPTYLDAGLSTRSCICALSFLNSRITAFSQTISLAILFTAYSCPHSSSSSFRPQRRWRLKRNVVKKKLTASASGLTPFSIMEIHRERVLRSKWVFWR